MEYIVTWTISKHWLPAWIAAEWVSPGFVFWLFCHYLFIFQFYLNIFFIYISNVLFAQCPSENLYSIPSLCSLTHPLQPSWPGRCTLRQWAFKSPRVSPLIDVCSGCPLLPMCLESSFLPCVLSHLCLSPWELWAYWLVHIVDHPMGLQTPSAPWVLSLVPQLKPFAQFNG